MLLLHCKKLTETSENRKASRAAQSAAAWGLLHEIAAEYGLSDAVLAKTSWGRPYYKGVPTVDFSLAHTSTLAVCAFWQKSTENAPRIGIDAEKRSAYSTDKIYDFALRFFGAHERRYVLNAKEPQVAFTRIFVRKEAYAKYCGDGIGKHLSATDTLAPDFKTNSNVRFLTLRASEHYICICLPLTCTEPLQRFRAKKRS